MTKETDSIDLVLKCKDEELYAAIGFSLLKTKMGVSPLSQSELAGKGKDWFNSRVSTFKSFVCENDEFQERIKSIDQSDEAKLCLMLADIIAQSCVGVPPVCISALILKVGLTRFCDGFKSRSN
jgi:hypothetical protein